MINKKDKDLSKLILERTAIEIVSQVNNLLDDCIGGLLAAGTPEKDISVHAYPEGMHIVFVSKAPKYIVKQEYDPEANTVKVSLNVVRKKED